VSDQTLTRAQAGDELAFRELTDTYRRELQLHCYRILGSVQDAEDALQETLVAAWRGLDTFEGHAPHRRRVVHDAPEPLEHRGHDAIARILANRFTWRGETRLRLVPTRANNQPAFGCYLPLCGLPRTLRD
jgi:hypothetical protein